MTNSMRQASILAFLLIALGMGVFVTKAVRHGFPLTPGVTTTVWDFEIYLEFAGQNRATRLEVFIPTSDAERNVSGEQFYNGPFGLSLTRDDDTRNRRAIWTYRYPEGRKVLRYTAQTIGETPDDPISSSLGRADRDARPFEGDMVRQQAFIVWTSTLRRRSADPLSQAALTIQEIFNPEGSDEIEVLLPDLPRPLAQLELARITLESQGVAARVVNGVFLSEGRRRADLRSWLEYRAGGEDVRYFPGGEPARFFTLWYGTDDFVDSRGASELDVQIALQGNR
ncbi:MAG: UUP1 family membrane protein, partial [Pseudomonadota bacterium]